ncbi:MAG: peptidylprolyl isomerase [Candidatus Omnitrophica bacterium]|nr:peptidylprolyl isomerase [Candidatus Omnitrophota bacterium]MDD5671554.1 peptidylprolyl isomerase [Candidatus Omnitrophota bacterium]
MKLFLCLFLLITGFAVPLAADAQLLDRVVAVVNDDAITQSELDVLMRPIYEQLRQEFQGEELFRRMVEVRRKLLNQIIEDRLVYQAAKAENIEADEAEINEMMTEFRNRFKSDEEMDGALKEQGLNRESIRDRLRRQSIVRTLHDREVRSKVVVSPVEVEEYYKTHPEDFTEKEQIRIRSITIKKSDEARAKGLKDEKAWEQIQALRKRILKGEDFGELAARYSEDVHASEGGIGGWVDRGEMIPAIDEAIFKLKNGEVSEVIETAMGYHIFKVEETKEGHHLTLEESREKIFGYLFHQKSQARFNEWMKELKKDAYISVR